LCGESWQIRYPAVYVLYLELFDGEVVDEAAADGARLLLADVDLLHVQGVSLRVPPRLEYPPHPDVEEPHQVLRRRFRLLDLALRGRQCWLFGLLLRRGVVAALDGEIDGDDEQKSATLLVDLAAGGKSEPARFRARMRGNVEEGRRRAQQAYATLAADIIPAPAYFRWWRPSVARVVRTKVLSDEWNGTMTKPAGLCETDKIGPQFYRRKLIGYNKKRELCYRTCFK
jgi:hypothetical protein